MKRFLITQTFGWLLVAALVGVTINGCQSPEKTTWRVTGTAIVTVNGLMSAYADACVAGLIASNKQAQVRDAYGKYAAAMAVEKAVILSYKVNQDTNALYQAVAAASAASADLIGLVQLFLPPDRLVKVKGGTP
jgi:hypothetical protein